LRLDEYVKPALPAKPRARKVSDGTWRVKGWVGVSAGKTLEDAMRHYFAMIEMCTRTQREQSIPNDCTYPMRRYSSPKPWWEIPGSIRIYS